MQLKRQSKPKREVFPWPQILFIRPEKFLFSGVSDDKIGVNWQEFNGF